MPLTLVFIHGWGFDKTFFEPMAPLLSQYEQIHIDLGFFDNQEDVFGGAIARLEARQGGRLLIGHSLGFAFGFKQRNDWQGFVSINGFDRFVLTKEGGGCVRRAALLRMQKDFDANASACLSSFYAQCGHCAPPSSPCNPISLKVGLQELAAIDIGSTLAAFKGRGLVLGSERDWLVPPSHTRSLARYVCGDIAMHEDASHLLPQTDPAWCARHIKAFIVRSFN